MHYITVLGVTGVTCMYVDAYVFTDIYIYTHVYMGVRRGGACPHQILGFCQSLFE